MKTITSTLAWAALVLAATGAAAQSTPDQRQGSETTPSSLPPGATSSDGNKAAVPASGAADGMSGTGTMPADPATGSTPGLPPGATSDRADKAMTPASNPATGR
ncbi:hypothetical protein CLD22_24015 [Rubrivivax gelatinosus]|nr:hypothetical protein [Rubrivivax gelatinosus]